MEIRNDYVKIDDEVFTVSDLDKVPEKYKPTPFKPPVLPDSTREQGAMAGAPLPGSIQAPTTAEEQPLPKCERKIKLTKAGYTFSGPTAYLSHMYRCDFVFSKTPYTSVEQGYHFAHANQAKDFELAKTIMALTNTQDIKYVAKDLPDSVEWQAMGPGVLWDLNFAKFTQNPDLKERLLQTAPHPIVEASVDTKWGGGCPYGSDIYEQGMVPGSNVAGKQLTKQRDQFIENSNSFPNMDT